MSISPRQYGRMAMFYLEEAVLIVLTENYDEGFGVGAADIGQRTGIYRDPGIAQMNDAIVTGVLNSLNEEGRVERALQENGRGGWKLTASEYNRRREDV